MVYSQYMNFGLVWYSVESRKKFICWMVCYSDHHLLFGLNKMATIFPKPLEIRTILPPLCSYFKWLGFGMVGTIAIAMTEHSKIVLLEIRASKCSVFQCLLFKPPLYLNCDFQNKISLSNKSCLQDCCSYQ